MFCIYCLACPCTLEESVICWAHTMFLTTIEIISFISICKFLNTIICRKLIPQADSCWSLLEMHVLADSICNELLLLIITRLVLVDCIYNATRYIQQLPSICYQLDIPWKDFLFQVMSFFVNSWITVCHQAQEHLLHPTKSCWHLQSNFWSIR